MLLGHAVAHYARPVVLRFGWLARRLPPTELTGPERLRRVFEDLGGSFIKLGQMLAMQPDILSMEYCNALYDLLDHVSPVPVGEIARVIREETGRSPEQLFDRFEPVPLASGSIGQVHVAWHGGRKLAVKVQRPDAQVQFRSGRQADDADRPARPPASAADAVVRDRPAQRVRGVDPRRAGLPPRGPLHAAAPPQCRGERQPVRPLRPGRVHNPSGAGRRVS